MSDARLDIEDIYPLSPMQQGILFDTLYAPQAGVYFEQAGRRVTAELDPAALRRAWQRVVERHPVLRTAFVWQSGREPFQVVRRRRELPWQELDWRGLAPAEQSARLNAFLAEDRRRGFKLDAPPLLRVTLIRLDDAYYFVWSHHHLLMDGWSVSLILREVAAFYEAECGGPEPELARPRPYRDYILWCRRQDADGAAAYWRRVLAGLTAPTPLGALESPAGARASGEARAAGDTHLEVTGRLPAAATADLRALCQRHRLTLYTATLGAWALLLSHYSGQAEVVCGTVVSGRPPELQGVEGMVGLFINAVPVRVRVEAGLPLSGWLAGLQQQMAELRQYEYHPLVQVQGWSAVPRGVPLFESVLIFENYPTAKRPAAASGGPAEGPGAHAFERSNVPLSVVAEPGREFALTLRYDSQRLGGRAVSRLLDQLAGVLSDMAADFDRPVGSVTLIDEREREQLTAAFNAELG